MNDVNLPVTGLHMNLVPVKGLPERHTRKYICKINAITICIYLQLFKASLPSTIDPFSNVSSFKACHVNG